MPDNIIVLPIIVVVKCWVEPGGRTVRAQNFNNMAAVCEDFFTGDDLEAILDIIEGDFVEESEEFNADIGALLSDIDPESVAVKTCKTKRGLTSRQGVSHSHEANVENRTPSAVKSPEEKLHPLYFKKFIQNGASKFALDECYSEKFRKEFSSYVVTYDDALFSYQFVRDLIGCFNGDLEKFYQHSTGVCHQMKMHLKIC